MRIQQGSSTPGACFISGTIGKEPEIRQDNWVKFGVRTSSIKMNDGYDNEWINVDCSRDMAAYAKSLKKGDVVLVAGATKKREYNGKEYVDLTADFIIKMEQAVVVNYSTVQRVPAVPSVPSVPSLDAETEDLPF